MSMTKGQSITSPTQVRRMIYIDGQLRKQKYLNCTTVAKAFGISRKTVLRDIECLRDLNAPIEYDEQRKAYYYTKLNYFLPSVMLNAQDVKAFTIAGKILKQYADAPYYRQVKKAFDTFLEALPPTPDAQSMLATGEAVAFGFTLGARSPLPEREFGLLEEAIEEKRQVRMTYHAFHKNEISERVVHPYHLQNHQGTWYLIAHCTKRNDVRIFALSRIRSIAVLDAAFDVPESFSVEACLKGSFELERSTQSYEVAIWFSAYQARWIRERVWHSSQRIVENGDGSMVLHLVVQSLEEVKRWVMQYGAEATVLAPKDLRAAVRDETMQMLACYQVKLKTIQK
jgi:predicted DNA-binding transcriptional regulator YafY